MSVRACAMNSEARRPAHRAAIECEPMVRTDLPGERRRLAHARRRGFSRATEERLAELGRRLPPPSEADREIMAADRAARMTRRLKVGFVVLFVVALGAGGAVQWLRPVSPPALAALT